MKIVIRFECPGNSLWKDEIVDSSSEIYYFLFL